MDACATETDEHANGARHIARVEAIEWWRRGVERTDLVAVWITARNIIVDVANQTAPALDDSWRGPATYATRSADSTHEGGALGWMEIHENGTHKRAVLRGWID